MTNKTSKGTTGAKTTRGTAGAKTLRLVQLGVLVAIMILFDITGIGYIKTAGVEITIMMIPVIIGAIVLGKTSGAILGGVFGITSFIQCFGKSAFGALLLGINPVATAVMCIIPRIIAGLLVGLCFDWLRKIDKTKVLSFGLSGLAGALANTVFFILSLMLLFGNSETFTTTMTSWGFPVENFFAFVAMFVGINGIIEAAVCFVVGASIAKAMVKFIPANETRG